ncbi:MAG: glycosyltransferase, partial [Candidatus Peregrinibacteria bacterium]
MKLALIADWLPTFGGAEHVIAEFHALWPQAPIFTTIARHGHLGPLDQANLRVSSLQLWYRLLRRHELLLPRMPRIMEAMDLRGYDVIVSSSHAVAKGIIPPSSAVHVCYCHTPMRYAWEMEEEYLRDFGVPRILRRTVKRFLGQMRRWDMTTQKRVDTFVANSTTTQERIARIYGRESTVIPPPVQERFLEYSLPAEERQGFLAIGRLVPYKRFDLLIETA